MKLRLCLFSFLFMISCSGRNRNDTVDTFNKVNTAKNNSEISHAKGFTITELNKGTLIYVFNPWKEGDTLASYYLVNDDIENRVNEGVQFQVKVPVENIITLSSTYIGMFSVLDERNRIIATSNASLIYDSVLYQRYVKGELIDLGEATHPNVETILGQSPDLVMKYIQRGLEEADYKIMQAGIPIAYNLEYMEQHPLGRAEWIKFVAAFIGKTKIADSIFNAIEDEYLRLSYLAMNKANKPSVLDGSSYKGTWYAAGGRSYPATLYNDAGAEYYWRSDSSSGSIPLSLEVIIENQADADYWIGPSTGSRKELLQIESRYALFQAFQQGNVYFFGKRTNPHGGYDYYESGVVHPHLILKDLIWVFHPDLLDKEYELVYLEKIK